MNLNNFILLDQIKIKIQLQLANLKHNNINGLKNKSSINRLDKYQPKESGVTILVTKKKTDFKTEQKDCDHIQSG